MQVGEHEGPCSAMKPMQGHVNRYVAISQGSPPALYCSPIPVYPQPVFLAFFPASCNFFLPAV